ncbi:tartrate-resistant acid phosphatase type 5-like [Styela clava]
MFVRTYGTARTKVVRNKGWSLGIATFLFFALVFLLRRHENAEKHFFHGIKPWKSSASKQETMDLILSSIELPAFSTDEKWAPILPIEPKWDDFKIGEVGPVFDFELPKTSTTPAVVKPHPKEFDDDGNEFSLRFLIVGDWGGQSEEPYTTPVQLNLAKALGEFARRYETKFTLSLGDNFCDEGVTDVDDPRFKNTFEDVFTAPSLKRPWYIIAGNDDYKGNVTAEIEYTKKSRRWFFEREYYKLSFQLPSYRNVSIDILMIDTVQLCGRILPGETQPIEPDDEEKAEQQWKWIEKNLKKSSASYLLVAGHYPVVSGGKHGSTVCLKRRLKPLLETYHVSAYFCGHDHSVQHYLGKDTKGVNYFVTGATHPRDDSPDHLDGLMDSSKFFWTASLDTKVGAFTYCDVTKDLMSILFVNTKQKSLYYTTLLPRANKHVVKKKPMIDEHIFDLVTEFGNSTRIANLTIE